VALVGVLFGKGLGKHVVHGRRRESYRESPFRVVPRHSGNVEIVRDVDFHRLVWERKYCSNLSHTVGSVVEHKHGVALFRSAGLRTACVKTLTLDARILGAADDRLDELVGDILSVPILDRLEEVISVDLVTLTIGESVDSQLDAIPSLVAVHGIVPTSDSADFSDADLLDVVLELLDVFGCGPGSGVTSVPNVVDVHVLNLVVLCSSKEGKEVLDVGVHTTIRNETEQMETRSMGGSTFHGFNDCGLLLKLVFLDAWGSVADMGAAYIDRF